mmetsp:Transcript_9366/g.25347  ORF Transcript_9366/g.25347 Transcript_9366/m.25347 type:complete len:252 (+) Transcript_9366:271-1026(+)
MLVLVGHVDRPIAVEGASARLSEGRGDRHRVVPRRGGARNAIDVLGLVCVEDVTQRQAYAVALHGVARQCLNVESGADSAGVHQGRVLRSAHDGAHLVAVGFVEPVDKVVVQGNASRSANLRRPCSVVHHLGRLVAPGNLIGRDSHNLLVGLICKEDVAQAINGDGPHFHLLGNGPHLADLQAALTSVFEVVPRQEAEVRVGHKEPLSVLVHGQTLRELEALGRQDPHLLRTIRRRPGGWEREVGYPAPPR